MALSFNFFLIILGLLSNAKPNPTDPISEENQNGWIAREYFHHNVPLEKMKQDLGILSEEPNFEMPVKKYSKEAIAELPEHFDPREKWPNCMDTLNKIRNQGECGSHWAIAAAGAMSDRICIKTNGNQKVNISAEDIMSCCFNCGNGCGGGFPKYAWKFWEENGIVSGGEYNSKDGCKPYSIEPCDHYIPGSLPICSNYTRPTPECERRCIDGYDVSYEKDKSYGKNIVSVQGEKDMMAELFHNGPIEGYFEVFTDFLTYKKGVYNTFKGFYFGWHIVKILGWGVEDDLKYWLVANSWGTDWGEKGFFKIRRGKNLCSIEVNAIAGEPAL